MKYALLSLLCLFTFLVKAQNNCDSNDFEQLITACKKKEISQVEFSQNLKIAQQLEKNKCYDYIKVENGKEHAETGLTYLMGQLCLRANTEDADKKYIAYVERNKGSAEEQLSFSMEYLFKQNPKRILTLIKSDKDILNHIVWGFVNNRMYGINDPKQNEPNKAYTANPNEPKPVLNSTNYKDIFYGTYPSLLKDNLHSNDIEYVLKQIYDVLSVKK